MNDMMKGFHEYAHRYVGVRFHHRGRTARGLDCVGLVIRCAMDCGYDRYEEFAYGHEPRDSVLQGVLEKHFGVALPRLPRINDVILMRLRRGGEPSHVGIITHHPNGLGLIHTHSMLSCVTYQRLSPRVLQAIAGVYQWPEKP